MSVIIKVENLSKKYHLGQIHTNLLSERFGNGLRSLYRKFHSLDHSTSGPENGKEEFWALRDISFEVQQGEVVGIIGRNGAGKSTLLKILSRITTPTSGNVELTGRVASLLEVGTGFHPELTGRENVYLNGAILGMAKAEIVKKFDQIVAFAEVQQFIDTPVKRYSSGMYVRLAFAVAAHLEPEILIVDEVLAVGDAQFQKKCLGKMGDVAKEGRTVLFVSHNMDAVRRLCSTAIWLEAGRVKRIGTTEQCISDYLLKEIRKEGSLVFDPPHMPANRMPVLLHTVMLLNEAGSAATHFSRRSGIRVQIEWESLRPVYKPRIGFALQTIDGLNVFTSFDASAWAAGWISPGRFISTCMIPGGVFNEGEYILDIGADSPKGDDQTPVFDFESSRTGPVLRFEIEDDMTLSSKYYGQEGFYDSKWPGVVLLDLPWIQTPLCQKKTEDNVTELIQLFEKKENELL
jgi:lipopolysaccharide transport system ATP-binding protein